METSVAKAVPGSGHRRLHAGGRLPQMARPLLSGASGVASLLVGWWIVAGLAGEFNVPGPRVVLGRAREWMWANPGFEAYGVSETGLLPNLAHTAANVVLAVSCGALVGCLVGFASTAATASRAAARTLAGALLAMPILIAAPFLLVWFGQGRATGLAIVALCAAAILTIYSQEAASNLPGVYRQNARVLGASRLGILIGVTVPGSLPEIVGGIRIALAGAWGLQAFAELLGATNGIGLLMRLMLGEFDVVGLFAALLVVGLLAVVADVMVVALAQLAFRWKR